jgi:LVIVD repeat-containing protein
MRPFLFTSLAVGLVVAACAPTPSPATLPAPAPAPASTAAPAPAPPPSAPAPSAPAATPAPAQQAPAATPEPGAAAADPFAAAGGRGGRGNPPPPPTPPPAVMPPPVKPVVSATPPSPDLRVGLAPGRWDAAQAAWNVRLVSTTPPSEKFLGVTNSDLAFTGKYAIQGNYNGFQIFDISNPVKPVPVLTYVCPASQSDVSVYKNLLFVSGEGQTGRVDCGIQGVPEPVSKDRLRGIRVFDISDMAHPKSVANVQTCRGSHTHTVVTDPRDKENVYIYVSGSAGVRSADELPGCKDGGIDDPDSARFRLEVIKVPLAAPQTAAIVSSPRIFSGLAPPPRRVEPGRGGFGRGADPAAGAAGAPNEAAGAATPPAGAPAAGAAGAAPAAAGAGAAGGRGGRGNTGPNQCHDITVYPEIGLAGGACGGYGLLLDIKDVVNPKRIDQAADINMSFWHSATFSNDGSKILFSDEWGGGSQPRCRETDKLEWGANALFTIENGKMQFKSYYKIPAAQTSTENCVAHNGSLIPIPGREVMVQGWYQGGISVFDWTDTAKPVEIAYFDRGPLDATRLITAGSWSVYWYNGLIVSSEIQRGLDIFELLPSGLISQNEIDAAKTVTFDYLNAQEQRKLVWPPSFAKARAFLDQLERSRGLAADKIAAARKDLAAAEKLSGAARAQALKKLATRLTSDAVTATDAAKVRDLATAVAELR